MLLRLESFCSGVGSVVVRMPPCDNLSMKLSPKEKSGTPHNPGETIRGLRQAHGLTLNDIGSRTGLSVSTLSKLEQGKASLSYDKLYKLSQALGVDMAQILESPASGDVPAVAPSGRRVIQRAGEGQLIDTRSYKQLYLATELLNKSFVPMVVDHCARTIEDFVEEFGGLIRHPGEEFDLVLEGEIVFHSDLYAPVRLYRGDSIYFDSEMGHAYLAGTDGACRTLAICSSRGHEQLAPEDLLARQVKPKPAMRIVRDDESQRRGRTPKS